MAKTLELISFALCPFVQRAVIMLKHKRVDFEITYIDLENPPAWFDRISPLGKVPVLKVDDDVIFESAVICELVDELNPPSVHPADPVKKAKERSWIEFGSSLFMQQYYLLNERDPAARKALEAEYFTDLGRLEEQLGQGPFFRGKEFGLVDAAIAPLFMRMEPVASLWNDPRLLRLEKTRRWANALLALSEVKDSVVPSFREDYLKYLREQDESPAA